MPDIALTQGEADFLFQMQKVRADDRVWDYPGLGGSVCIPLQSSDGRERFILDIWRSGSIALEGRYQNVNAR